MEIDISGLNKLELLKTLWKHQAHYCRFTFFSLKTKSDFGSHEKAEKAIASGKIDIYQGRAIRCDLSGTTVDPKGYDLATREGNFYEIVETQKDKREASFVYWVVMFCYSTFSSELCRGVFLPLKYTLGSNFE